MTSRRDLCLQIVTADCVPVLLADRTRLIAVHAGWRGLASGALARAVQSGGEAGDLRAWIGPAIGSCCYEVGADVARKVLGNDWPGSGPKAHLNLTAIAREQLLECGVEHIADLEGLCTSCERGELWSYRRDGEEAGRNIALVWRE